MSNAVAPAFAQELRDRGLDGSRPAPPGVIGQSGAERRMAGAIGAKKVDVTWATEESGLLLAVSVKTINFRDKRSGNFQKNLTNRRSDLLYEAVTLHRRFPYSVLAGFLFLDKGAAADGTPQRRSTFLNAHHRLKLFDGRNDPAGRDEQYERLYIVLLDANPFTPNWETYRVGDPDTPIEMSTAFDEFIALIAERNPDFYDCVDGKLRKVT
ncbi:MAG: hypothetical protein JJU45_15260 [Acidimicrobiia bacterium]|nr:hypothetical protein [Acidimicrobiia bacterium]